MVTAGQCSDVLNMADNADALFVDTSNHIRKLLTFVT